MQVPSGYSDVVLILHFHRTYACTVSKVPGPIDFYSPIFGLILTVTLLHHRQPSQAQDLSGRLTTHVCSFTLDAFLYTY